MAESSLHMGTDISRPEHTLFMDDMGVRFSLLELSTRLRPRYLTVLVGGVGTACTMELPACRHGPGMARRHSSD